MNKVLYEIGSIVVSVILFAVPVLTFYAFTSEWAGLVKMIFLVLSVLEIGVFHEVLSDYIEL